DFLIEVGDRIESGDTDLRESGLFEEAEAQPDSEPDEDRGPEANEKQLKKLFTAVKKLKSLRSKAEDAEENQKDGARAPPRTKRKTLCPNPKRGIRLRRANLGPSRHVHEA